MTSGNRWVLPGAVALIVIAAIAAILASQSPGASRSSTPSPSVIASPSPSVIASTPASAIPSTRASPGSSPVPTVAGTAIDVFTGAPADPAVGKPAPIVTGYGFDGSPAAIQADGRPKAVIFVAHWCPHCQREVPLIQAWLDANGPPAGVDMILVVTAIDPKQPNYPPDQWLAREHWSLPVIADPTGTIATAYGLPGYPYFVLIGADGRVAARTAGEIPIDALAAAIKQLGGS